MSIMDVCIITKDCEGNRIPTILSPLSIDEIRSALKFTDAFGGWEDKEVFEYLLDIFGVSKESEVAKARVVITDCNGKSHELDDEQVNVIKMGLKYDRSEREAFDRAPVLDFLLGILREDK